MKSGKNNIKMSLKKIDKDMSYSSKWKTTILTFILGTFVPPPPPSPPKSASLRYSNFILKYLSFTCLKSFLSVHQTESISYCLSKAVLSIVCGKASVINFLLICLLLLVCQLPRAKDTAAFSGGGLKRFVKSVGDTMFHLTTKMSESDQVCFN